MLLWVGSSKVLNEQIRRQTNTEYFSKTTKSEKEAVTKNQIQATLTRYLVMTPGVS